MKKIYNSPAIETLEVRATFAICEGSPGGDNMTGGNNMFPTPLPPRGMQIPE